jgi:tetratricopeptide (TPR) repeat protein
MSNIDIHCFVCPISLDMMEDPVVTPSGHSFEREALEEWIDNGGEDPLTRQPLSRADLRPNIALRDAIEEWKQIDSKWQERVDQLKAELRAAAESAAPAAAASSSSRESESHLLQMISYMQSRPMYANRKARVGVTATLDVAPLLRTALALHRTSAMFTENREQIVKGMIAGMYDNGEEMRRIFDPLVHIAGTAGTKEERSWLHTQLGTAYHKKGKSEANVQRQKAFFKSAIEQFQTAAAIDPTNAEAKRHWGWDLDRLALYEKDATKKTKMLEDALDLFDSALKIDPHLAEVFDNKGRTLRALGRHDEAKTAFERCVKICPDHIQALCALGELHKQQNEWAQAEKCFQSALNVNPRDAITTSKLGKLYQVHGNSAKPQQQAALWRAAVDMHKKAIQLDPNSAPFYADCGYCLARLHHYEQARAMNEKGLRIDPDNRECKKNLEFLDRKKS